MKRINEILMASEKDIYMYIDILKQWQKAVNLISKTTLDEIWTRHIMDSAQIYPLLPKTAETLVDLGSGAGFPALVLAILNKNQKGNLKQITLIESDTKKCLFLKEVARQLSLPVQILNQRIEKVQNLSADVVTARALASLNELLILGKNIITRDTTCLFLKGQTVQEEIKNITFPCQIEKIKSITNSNSFIIKMTEVSYD